MQNKKRKQKGKVTEVYFAIAVTCALALVIGIMIGLHLPRGVSSSVGTPTNYSSGGSLGTNTTQLAEFNQIKSEVLPQQGYVLPAKWENSIKQLVDDNALNVSALTQILNNSGQPLTAQEQQILNGTSTINITINSSDSKFVLLVLWSLGINNNDTIISNGPIMKFGGNPDNLASTGGYGPLGTLQLGKLDILNLTPQEQMIANYTALNSYRPCCNNPTMFPDCNHGAAALGLIELMISQGANTTAVFTSLKEFNSFEYPQQYTELAMYLKGKGVDFSSVPGYIIVSRNFSSGSAVTQIQQSLSGSQVGQAGSGSGCGA